MKLSIAAALCASLLLTASAASAANLETLSDQSSGRMFAIRVTPPVQVAGAMSARPTMTTLRATADAFIAENRELIGVADPARDLIATPVTTDRLGLSRVKYFQTWQGLEVMGGEVAVHLDRDGQVTYVKTKVARELPADVTPRVPESRAQDLALEAAAAQGANPGGLTILSTKLLILPLGIVKNEPSEQTDLAWSVEVVDAETGGERLNESYFIDAHSGAKLLELSGNIQLSRQSYDCAGGANANTCQLDVESPLFPGYFHGRTEGMPVRGPYPNPALPLYYGSTDVDATYDHLGALNDYYSSTFGINGPNGFGGTADWPNVPQDITRGVAHPDGGAAGNVGCPGNAVMSTITGTVAFCRGMVVPDVVGHEYAHTIVHHSFHDANGYPIGATYYGETGALNEGYADFMGEVYENVSQGANDWIMGTGTVVFPDRNLIDPHAVNNTLTGAPYPDRHHDSNFYCGTSDQGGVHANLTVPAHAFYLIAEGGHHATHTSCVIQAQGIEVAQQVFFRGWRNYFSSTVSFNEAYADLIQASNDLYPASVTAEVTKALQAVEMDQPGLCSGQPETQPPCAVVGVGDPPTSGTQGVRLLSDNPSHGVVRFGYHTAHAGRVEARVHDLAGRVVARPVRAYQVAGEQIGAWDAQLESGERAKPGAYWLIVKLDGEPIGVRKLLLLH